MVEGCHRREQPADRADQARRVGSSAAVSLCAVRLIPRSTSLTVRGLTCAASASSPASAASRCAAPVTARRNPAQADRSQATVPSVPPAELPGPAQHRQARAQRMRGRKPLTIPRPVQPVKPYPPRASRSAQQRPSCPPVSASQPPCGPAADRFLWAVLCPPCVVIIRAAADSGTSLPDQASVHGFRGPRRMAAGKKDNAMKFTNREPR
jgi:hypothetical protein